MSESQLVEELSPTAGDQPRPATNAEPQPIIILPVRGMVLFPGMVIPITVSRKVSAAAAQQAVREGRPIGIVAQRDDEIAEPAAIDLHAMGTIATILRYVTTPDGAHHLVCQGVKRFQIVDFVQEAPVLLARVREFDEPSAHSPEIEGRFNYLKQLAGEALELLPQAPPELVSMMQGMTSAAALTDLAAAHLDIKREEKQEILETIDLLPRMQKVTQLLAQRIEVMRITQEIGRQTKAALDQRQNEVILREQMAAIQRKLGEDGGQEEALAGISEAIAKAGMPPDIEQKARKELRRLERMPEASPEHGMTRAYLDRLTELPWRLPEEPTIDLARDVDHRLGVRGKHMKSDRPCHRAVGIGPMQAGGRADNVAPSAAARCRMVARVRFLCLSTIKERIDTNYLYQAASGKAHDLSGAAPLTQPL